MSLPCQESPGWSRRRWLCFVGAVLLAHVVLVFWFGERAKPVGVTARAEPALKLLVDSLTNSPFLRSPQLTDPTLFALPSHAGFSGGAWLEFTPAVPEPPVWEEPPRWLPPQTNELAAGLILFIATNKPNGAFTEVALNNPLHAADVLIINDTVTTQSLVRILGPLSKRPLAAPLSIRNPVYPDVLPDTVVQVRVNREGLNESAIVQQSCGVKPVDESALAAARQARFVPAGPGPGGKASGRADIPDWGRMVFQWFTIPPPATNLTAL